MPSAPDHDETLVAPASAPCGARVADGAITLRRPSGVPNAPGRLEGTDGTPSLRPARVSELGALRRAAPQPELIDRALVAHGSIRVLLCAGEIVGAIGWLDHGVLPPSPAAPTVPGEGRAVLRLLFVAPTHQRQGLGRRLLDACADELRARGHRALDVDAPVGAVPYLVRRGFRAIAGPAASGHPDAREVRMSRNLAPIMPIV